MSQLSNKYVYGPVPSRRLGRSLGIDLVPFKTCTYDCIYCQLGRTTNKTIERKEYIGVDEILTELEQKLADDPRPDYISLAGSGEPTLNSGTGHLIKKIKELTDIPVAVLTNGSLLWLDEVQDELMGADLVLPSLDGGDSFLFQYVNRPHPDLSFMRMVGGIASFAKRFQKEVRLEVLLLAGVTGIPSEAKKIAAIARHIGAGQIQLNTAWRPCSEEFAFALPMNQIQALAKVFPGEVEIISEKENKPETVSSPSDAGTSNILGLLRRRPCTLEGISRGLGMHVAETIKRMDALLAAGKVDTVVNGGVSYYVAADPKKVSEVAEEKSAG